MTLVEHESLKAIMQENKETNNAKFATVDRRFEYVDKRFDDLERNIDKRFDALGEKLDSHIEWTRELIEKMDKRLEDNEKLTAALITKNEFKDKVIAIISGILVFTVTTALTLWGLLKK